MQQAGHAGPARLGWDTALSSELRAWNRYCRPAPDPAGLRAGLIHQGAPSSYLGASVAHWIHVLSAAVPKKKGSHRREEPRA